MIKSGERHLSCVKDRKDERGKKGGDQSETEKRILGEKTDPERTERKRNRTYYSWQTLSWS